MPDIERGAPRFSILGPLEVIADSGPLRIGSRLQRLLLTMLLVEMNRVVSADVLVEALWGDDLPEDPAGALRTQVSRLRRALPEGNRLIAAAGGYNLTVDPDELDAWRFQQLLADAADLPAEPAVLLIDEALRLWRGAPLEEFADWPFAQIEAHRLNELRGAACEKLASLMLAAARPAEAAAIAEALLADHPERERARALLMEALYQQGRHTDAIDIYQSWRRQLAEQSGLEPSPALRELEQRILQHTVEREAPRSDRVPAVSFPRPVSSFVGRDDDLRALAELLGRARLVTLWGPGGVGKTRLALEVIARVLPAYPDGVHFCDLSVLAPHGDVSRLVANVIGVREQGGRPLQAQLVDRLAGHRTLVVLDNCEHVLPGAAKLAQRFLQSTDAVDVLATSRERLGVDAEHVCEVAPLAATDADSPAVTLFLDRARATHSLFQPSPGDLDTIADVCRCLDGLPLAVELAAARSRGLSPDELRRTLDQRFEILTGGAGSPNRHRSLQAVIDWSYAQLGRVEQRVFDRLSVFRSPFDLDDATAVASGDGIDSATIIPSVLRLLDCALLVGHSGSSSSRYSMLDTVRHFGLNRLETEQSAEAASERHARWALVEAERAREGLASATEADWAAAVKQHLDELRSAHGWLVGHDVDGSLRLIVALRPYALWRGHSEIFRWAEVAAAAATAAGTSSALLPEVLLAVATGAWQRGDLERATAAAHAATEAASALGSFGARAALEASADVALLAGDLERAVAGFTSAYEVAVAGGDLLQAVWDIGSAAVAVGYQGDREQAVAKARLAFATAERCCSPSAQAFANFVTGEVLAYEQPTKAETLFRQAIELGAKADSLFVVGFAEVALAASRARQQDVTTALAYCESAVRRWHQAGTSTPLWVTLRTVIAVLVRVGASAEAAMLSGAAESPRTGLPPFGADATAMREAAARLRGDLGEEEFLRRIDMGRAMTDEEAIRLALDAIAAAAA